MFEHLDEVVNRTTGEKVHVWHQYGGDTFLASDGVIYLTEDFARVEEMGHRDSIVAVLDEFGTPLPARRPFVHASRESAETEARRLAEKHTGQTFAVFEMVSLTDAPPVRATTRAA